MRAQLGAAILGLFCLCQLSFAVENLQTQPGENRRDGKVFSLFSIVTFKNQGCASQGGTTSQGNVRNGTCYTSTECSDKGGTASGNCAAGFGVCCLFVYTTSGSTIAENCTYVRNPGFPSAYSSTSSITYTVEKCATDVCDLRMDFESFTTLGPTDTQEDNTDDDCRDSFTVATGNSATYPTICGSNAGDHLYVDFGTGTTDKATLTFTWSSTTSTTRVYEIKLTQIPCSASWRPPAGCFQYYTGTQGRIQTFNFDDSSSIHLKDQNYAACIRRKAGYCCVEYTVCPDIGTPGFSLDTTPTTDNTADVGTRCVLDHINIEGGGGSCSLTGPKVSRYCGERLGVFDGTTISISICDCTAPFKVDIVTDALADTGTAAGPSPAQSRGVCLEYRQIACSQVA